LTEPRVPLVVRALSLVVPALSLVVVADRVSYWLQPPFSRFCHELFESFL
jgi:hypothetical protein